MRPKNAGFARRHTHTRRNARPKGWLVAYQDENRSKKTLRFDTWLGAFLFWRRLKRMPFNYQAKIFKGE